MTFNFGAMIDPNPKGRVKPATTAANLSAHQILNSFLNNYGLGDLAQWAWQTYTQAGGGTTGMDLVQAELPQQQAFKQRFPAIGQRVASGLPAITPQDYINYESTLRQAFSAHGLPLPTTGPEFDSIITNLLNNDVSASEAVNQRIGASFDRIANAPAEVRQAAYGLWGVNGDKALAAALLSPTTDAATIDRMSQSAEIMGTAQRFGIDVNAERAGRLQTLGADQNLGQFGKLAQEAPLFATNPGETGPNITMGGEGLSAVFGENPQAAALVQRRLQARAAEFAGGGNPQTSSALSNTPGEQGIGTGPV